MLRIHDIVGVDPDLDPRIHAWLLDPDSDPDPQHWFEHNHFMATMEGTDSEFWQGHSSIKGLKDVKRQKIQVSKKAPDPGSGSTKLSKKHRIPDPIRICNTVPVPKQQRYSKSTEPRTAVDLPAELRTFSTRSSMAQHLRGLQVGLRWHRSRRIRITTVHECLWHR